MNEFCFILKFRNGHFHAVSRISAFPGFQILSVSVRSRASTAYREDLMSLSILTSFESSTLNIWLGPELTSALLDNSHVKG